MKRKLIVWLLCPLALMLAECSTNVELDEIRMLRKSGEWSACRLQALAILEQKPNMLPLWPEIALATASMTRAQAMDANSALPLLAEAALATGAMYRFKAEAPPPEWSEAGRLVAMELMRLLNLELGGMNAERRIAQSAAQAEMQRRLQTDRPDWHTAAIDELHKIQAGARLRVRNITLITALLSNLPGYRDSGTISLLEQLGAAKQEWMQSLSLEAGFAQSIAASVQEAVDNVQRHAQGDLREVGYLLPATITENGIFK